MIKISFTNKDLERIQYNRFNHPHPHVQRKMECLLLKHHGLTHKEICSIVGISPSTLRRYFKQYLEGGIEALEKVRFYQPQSDLMPYFDSIKEMFEQEPPQSVKEAAHRIEKQTGVKRSYTQIREFLDKLGMKRRKTGSIPSKADLEKQKEFKENELEPRLEQARDHKRIVYFVDAAHFVFAPFLGYLWCFVRQFVKAPAGRKRFNVLGALNAVSHELVRVTNDSYINGESVCELLREIAKIHIDVPITLILDNARYQKCKIVFELAAALDIELLYLPPYSPNLNLIERMWKFTKQRCLRSRYFEDFSSFSKAIDQFLNSAHETHSQELSTLLTHKFQDLGKLAQKKAA